MIPPVNDVHGPGRPTRVRWGILGLLLVFAGLCHFNRVSMSVAGTEHILRETGITKTRMGLVYSVYLLVYAACMTPGGWLIDRRGPRAALLLMGFGSSIFVLLTGVTGWAAGRGALLFGGLLAVRGLLGAVTAPLHPAAARMVQAWTPPPERSLGNGLVNAAALLGIALTYPVFGWLADRLGWPAALVLSGIVTALSALLFRRFAKDDPARHPGVNDLERGLIRSGRAASGPASGPPAPPAPPASGWGPLFRSRCLILLTLSYAAVGYFQYLFFYWMQFYFDDILHLEPTRARMYTMIAMLAMGLGMAGGGWLFGRAERSLGTRRGRAGVSIVSMTASAVFLALGILTRSPGSVVLFFTLAMGAIGTCEAAFWTTATDVGGSRGGLAAALMNTGGNVGGLLAPVITPLFSGYFGWQSGLGLACGVSLAGAAMWIWIDPAERE